MEKTIHMTPLAVEKALEYRKNNPTWEDFDVRLYIEGKGCDGFYYGVTFDKSSHDDLFFPQSEVLKVLVDPETIKYVQGSTIEWIDDERGQGFLVENPGQKKFRGKFFKRKDWENKVL